MQEAYSILSDPEKRRSYDSGGGVFGVAASTRARSGAASAASATSSPTSSGRAAAAPGTPRPERGRDLETDVHISFDQAMDGAQVPVSVPLSAPCATCRGTGAKPGHLARGLQPLPRPRRRGRVAGALLDLAAVPPAAAAPAPRSRSPCPTCSGTGRTRQVKRYRVNIPAGVRDGSRVRLAGKGEAGPRGGPQGDLYVVTRVGASDIFERKGDNLEVEVPITIPEAIAGATIEVPTLAGSKRIRVPPGTQHGTVQRLRGEGPPKLGGRGRGDIRYRLVVDVPRSLSREQAEVVDELATVMDGNPRSRLLSGRGE